MPGVWLGTTRDPRDGFPLGLIDELTRVRERQPWTFPPVYTAPELYGLGRALRVWLGLPRLLPIAAYGDHGVFFTPELPLHERTNRLRVHLTWSQCKAEAARHDPALRGRRVVFIQHPYVGFRTALGISRAPEPRGVLVFLDHSVPGYFDVDVDPHAIRRALSERLDVGETPVVSLHRFDVERGVHRRLAEVGIPVVTAGRGTSPYFVDRFYAMIRGFSRVITDLLGSHVLYCDELGLPVEFLPVGTLTRRSASQSFSEKGARLQDLADPVEAESDAAGRLADTRQALAAAFTSGNRAERDAAVDRFLGRSSTVSRAELRAILTREALTTAPRAVWDQRAAVARRLRSTHPAPAPDWAT
jgi:hypothetical protein